MTIRKSMLAVLALCLMAFAQDKPKVAVYATGGKSASENKALSNKMTNALVSSGKYRTIERSDAFLEQVAAEQAKQRQGAIDDRQISRIGKQSGAEFVCIAEMVEAFGGHQISARVVNVETVEVTLSGEAHGTLNTIQAFDDIANNVIASMFGLPKKPVNTQAATVPTAANMLVTIPSTGTVSNITGTLVPGSNLTDKLAWLQRSAESHNTYIVEVNANESIAPQIFEYKGAINITVVLKGDMTNRTIRLKSHGEMFTVRQNVTLILDNNITIQGHSGNTGALIFIDGGVFKMNIGSTISGNDAVALCIGTQYGNLGTFTMNGGTISGNSNHGVWIRKGSFTMNNGIISGNNKAGIAVGSGTSFTMINGTITGNTSSNGGGIWVDHSGTFTMRGGNIVGNVARENGGGVYVRQNGIFTKTGGNITGYTSDHNNGNVVKDEAGNVIARSGHAVSANTSQKRKETTAGSGADMSYSYNKAAGAWDE